MTGRIGYYVHHHGDGHCQRALEIARQAPERFILIGTGLQGRTEGLECLDLADDRPCGVTAFEGLDAAEDRPDALHYAPIQHQGVRQRVAKIANWIETAKPALMVVDVSVEVAMLARLCATPTVCVRLNGRRDDPAHLDAFRGARALICPFAAPLDALETPDWVRRKTLYMPGLTPLPSKRVAKPEVVLVVAGKGGPAADGARLAQAALSLPDLQWRVAGPVSDLSSPPPNLTLLGWSQDMSDEIAAAGVVVGGAGNGLVNAVLAAGRPFLCLPEPRPFDEQTTTARRLQAVGAAVVHFDWPSPSQWPDLIERARRIAPSNRDGLYDPSGPQLAAQTLINLAENRPPDRSRPYEEHRG